MLKKHLSSNKSRAAACFIAFALVFAVGCMERAPGYSENYGDERVNAQEEAPRYGQFIGSIYFRTASAVLSRSARSDVARMAERIEQRRSANYRVIIIGYADKRRGSEEGVELANERAQRVALALEKSGINLDRLIIDSRPMRLTKKTGERRVDIYLERALAQRFDSQMLYPLLVGVFLLTVFVIGVVIFRRRN